MQRNKKNVAWPLSRVVIVLACFVPSPWIALVFNNFESSKGLCSLSLFEEFWSRGLP
jgi:hypothetical protein